MASTVGKIVSRKQLTERIRKARRHGLTIAFTNGCFDLLHAGHVKYLEAAKSADRFLIVGLNSDDSVRRLKGRGRPVNTQRDRARVLAGLACVDAVVIFSEDTPLKLIKAVQPDVLIKGADWRGRGVVGEEEVRARGGRVELIPLLKGRSTTRIISSMEKRRITGGERLDSTAER